MASSEKIPLSVTHGRVFVWNAQDAHILRSEHRIVGTLVGGLPRNPHQCSMNGLPLYLLPEEVTLLVEEGIATLISHQELTTLPENIKAKIHEHREKSYHEQVLQARKDRESEIRKMADVIVAGKKKKLEKLKKGYKEFESNLKNLDKETIIENEMKKIQSLPRNLQVLQTFTEQPFIKDMKAEEVDWKYPDTRNEVLHYAVYQDLWKKGYYISSGMKFGGDYIAYKGDPHLYHACLIVRCVEDEEGLNVEDLVMMSRIGTTTKKTLVLASLNKDNDVHYHSMQWAGDELF
ncbi:tRNA-splicing endonuclease subunit Sen34-like [Oratosquilla oratoria]|uniref:tRNA-splicing endonuclease subunit Sen34-like n=1 Tax=Oratosquilla oratoria TaxID=337810 RepID=UPI003F763DEF